MELISSDTQVVKNILEELSKCGCCSRCILRYLGAKEMFTYRGNSEEMTAIVQQCRETGTTASTVGQETGVQCMDTGDTTVKKTVQDTVSDVVNGSNKEEEAESDVKENEANGSVHETSAHSCIVCLGILEKFAEEDFLDQIKKETVDDGFHFTNYMCSLMTPVCVILREHALMLHLKEKFKSVYGHMKDTEVTPIKDVWKWRNGPKLNDILNAPFDYKSAFDITLTFQYENSGRECSFLMNSSSSDTFRKRKKDRRFNKKAAHTVYTRANVAKAIDDMTEEEFRRSYQCPPVMPSGKTTCDIKCQNENVFVAGRYNKYSRELSQTPWIIDGARKSESSVEELLSEQISKHFKHTEQKFSSSGREDVDVRMLGNGRPFVLELVNPRRRNFSQAEMSQMEECINSATEDIKCRDLQIVSKEETEILKQGEIDKVKIYKALCWAESPVTDQQLAQISNIKDLKIFQKTPIRVLHRRPLATRDKLIQNMTAQRVDETHFTIDLSTQAGTYIKEFIHGDFGRTKPNLSTIIGVVCDILELDVTAIELDWPKTITTDKADKEDGAS